MIGVGIDLGFVAHWHFALGNGASEGSIQGSLVILMTFVTFGIFICETSR